MHTKNIFDIYYYDALGIHAMCADLHLPTTDAKLFTYIHVKANQPGGRPNYFQKEQFADVRAIKILLGETDNTEKITQIESIDYEWARDVESIFIANKLLNIDRQAHDDFGFEFPLRYELQNRLRLYEDVEFRETKLKFYGSEIAPRLSLYDVKRSEEVFERERLRNGLLEQQLRRIFS